jgi:dihydroorotase
VSETAFQNCRIVDRARDFCGSVGIHGGKIAWVSEEPVYPGARDLGGLLLTPAFVDLHAHLRTPGQTEKEDFAHCLKAALKSGFAAICGMANTSPAVDSASLLKDNEKGASKLRLARYRQIGALGLGLGDDSLSPLSEMLPFTKLFSNDGKNISSEAFLRNALRQSREKGFWVLAHCEPETEMVRMHLRALEKEGGNLHFCHISRRESVEAIREAKARGLSFTSEATPHHLYAYGLPYSVNPGFGSRNDRASLLEAVRDGTIEILATDHAPHTPSDKRAGACGISNMDYAFSMLWSVFRDNGIPFQRLSDMLSYQSAQKAGFCGIGLIEPGMDADLAIIDAEEETHIDTESFLSKSSNTPFNGATLLGVVKMTMVKGEIRYKNSN